MFFGYYPLYSDLSWSIWKDGIGSLGFSGPRVKEEMAIRHIRHRLHLPHLNYDFLVRHNHRAHRPKYRIANY